MPLTKARHKRETKMKQNKTFIFLLLAAVLFSLPVFAAGEGEVTDSVEAYVYFPQRPESIQPIFKGESVPPGAVIYLPNPNSSINFSSQGNTITLSTPGFYSSTGEPITVSAEVQAAVSQGVQTTDVFQGGGSASETQAEMTLAVDDPQDPADAVVTSPST